MKFQVDRNNNDFNRIDSAVKRVGRFFERTCFSAGGELAKVVGG